MYSLLYRHILRKHVTFLFANLFWMYNLMTNSLRLNWCEIMNVAIHTCEHFKRKKLLIHSFMQNITICIILLIYIFCNSILRDPTFAELIMQLWKLIDLSMLLTWFVWSNYSKGGFDLSLAIVNRASLVQDTRYLVSLFQIINAALILWLYVYCLCSKL